MIRFLFVLALVGCGGQTVSPREPTPASRTKAPATEATAEAAYDAKQWQVCGEQYTELATAVRSEVRRAMLWSAACCYALDGKADLAFTRLNEAVAAGMLNAEGVQKAEDLARLHSDPRWAELIAAIERSIAALKAPELRTELLELLKIDQAARQVVIEQVKRGEKGDWGSLRAVDDKSAQALKRAIAQYGWPGKSVVGDDGAHAAWLLVQHADRDLALQKDALARMTAMLAAGEVRKIDLAYLEDRVAAAEHRKQRYGTQFNGSEPLPIEDEAHVDERRKELGLGTMAEYRAEMRKEYGALLDKKPAQ